MVQESVLTTAPEFIAKCGTSGIPSSIDMLGSVQPPERNSCSRGAVPVVVGEPNAPFSHTPQARRSIGTTMSPSAFSTSGTGGSGSRP